jgi:geranylgeranyl diphosphate synthase type II
MRHAVFPGGARVRPRLCLEVARACGGTGSDLEVAAAVSVELLHCASLVHDDMPEFDDAPMRRGQLSVHAAYGTATALLVGDALLVQAFASLSEAGARDPSRLAPVLQEVVRGVSAGDGIIGGQAWELEPAVELGRYHRAKTGALFEAAVAAGAAAAGADPGPWSQVGVRLGEAWQVADDLGDALGDAARLGKPVGQDAAHGRPNAVAALGVDGALGHFGRLVQATIDAIPPCSGRGALRSWLSAAMLRGRDGARAHATVARTAGEAQLTPLRAAARSPDRS